MPPRAMTPPPAARPTAVVAAPSACSTSEDSVTTDSVPNEITRSYPRAYSRSLTVAGRRIRRTLHGSRRCRWLAALVTLAGLVLAVSGCRRESRATAHADATAPTAASRPAARLAQDGVVVLYEPGTKAEATALLEISLATRTWLARVTGIGGDMPMTVHLFARRRWLASPRSRSLPYGMPFSTPATRAIYMPAVQVDYPAFLRDIVEAVDLERLEPTERARLRDPFGGRVPARSALLDPGLGAEFYRAILVHEIWHLFHAVLRLPWRPKWLSEGLPQLAVLEASRAGILGGAGERWIALNRALFMTGRDRMPIKDMGRIDRLYTAAPPLAYSWYLGGLFIMYESLCSAAGPDCLRAIVTELAARRMHPPEVTDRAYLSVLERVTGAELAPHFTDEDSLVRWTRPRKP